MRKVQHGLLARPFSLCTGRGILLRALLGSENEGKGEKKAGWILEEASFLAFSFFCAVLQSKNNAQNGWQVQKQYIKPIKPRIAV